MKKYNKFIISCSILSLSVLSSQRVFSQHYEGLTPDKTSDKNNTTTTTKVKKSILNFGFFSPLNHHLSFGYDQLVGTSLILSSQVGIIGPGFNQMANPSQGAFVEVGPKFFFSPDWIMDGMRRFNAMQGAYFKPELVISVFSQSYTSYNFYNYGPSGNQSYTGVALMLNFGRQWIFANSFVLDMYIGIGYDLTSDNSSNINNEPTSDNYFSYISFGSSFPLAISGGINLGIPF